MNITIEKASPADAAELLDFLKQVGGETDNLTFGSEGVPFSVEAEAAYIAGMEHSRDNIMLVAKDNGRIVGTAVLSRLSRRMAHRGDFCITVAKEYWNRGIGSQLLEAILDFARVHSFEVLDLQVRHDNARAIRLYEKYGFEKIGEHPAFFKMDEEYICFDLMCLRLNSNGAL